MIDAVSSSLATVSQIIQAELTNSPRLIRRYTTELAAGTGKSLRALTVLTVAYDEEADAICDAAVYLAAAIELVHLASLVHDDVIDMAPLRRGFATIQTKYGNKIAILTGDYLLARALAVAAKAERAGVTPPAENLRHYVERVCIGEIDEQSSLFEATLTLRDLLRIIEGKTAAMFEGSVVAGAVAAKLSDAEVEAYRRYGHAMGMVFQILDDCLDYEQDEKRFGKPVNSDMSKGVMTLPLYYALKEHSITFAELQEVWHPEADILLQSTTTVGSVLAKVRRSGALLRSRQVACHYESKAMRYLTATGVRGKKRLALIKLLNLAMRKIDTYD